MNKKKLMFLVLYSGFPFALGISALGLIFYKNIIDLYDFLFFVFSTMCVFILDRLMDYDIDKTRVKRSVLISLLVVNILLGLTFSLLNAKRLVILLFFLFMGISYPIYLKKITRVIFMFKNIIVSVMSMLAVYLQMSNFDFTWLSKEKIFFVAVVFVFSLIIQISFDYKDIKNDSNNSLKTLPVVLGIENTYKVQIASIMIIMFFSHFVCVGIMKWAILLTGTYLLLGVAWLKNVGTTALNYMYLQLTFLFFTIIVFLGGRGI